MPFGFPRGSRFALCVMLALTAGCRRKSGLPPDANTVATVNGEPLSRAQFEREMSRLVDAPQSGSDMERVKRVLLDRLVERRLLLQAAKEKNIAVAQTDVDRRVLRDTSDYPPEQFGEVLAREQLTAAELKQNTAELMTIEKLFQEHVYPRVGITEAELRTYFTEHEETFQQPAQVRASQIVVKESEEAKRILAQLKGGQKFADLARKYSLSPDAKVGGDLGYFAKGDMPPPFDEVAFRLGINQISDVVASAYGFHLVKVTDKRPAKKRNFVEARGEVEDKLLKERRTSAEQEFVAQLRQKAVIDVNEAALSAAQPKPVRAAVSPEP